ncbi:baseplate assembly protein [Bosea minatitlanensis]|uniref:Baseplate J/gp47 family protein n=1 Tax=Bosea minatitlanensis TaxID=128782 RepID=A0ABW0EZY5_9HYPH|nr:baseplate J/gp47 family protein [Bosea minatitlanensis]MCT4491810.1 baseplate J/gp47 family protein [Bosea minatitlanensis]
MSRFTPVDLSQYPISDVIEALDFESYLARDRATFTTRWEARRLVNPSLPAVDTLLLEPDPSSVVLEVGSLRETLLRGRINDRIRALTLAGAPGRALDHIGITYYRTPRRVITPATDTATAVMEDDETYRQRLALAPESWSTAGPVGAYLFWALSASGDVLDVAAYSEDEGVTLAPRIRVVILPRDGLTDPEKAALVVTVKQALSRDRLRPMGDLVTVEFATDLSFDVTAHLRIRQGASADIVKAEAEKRILQYCSGRLRWIGDDIEGPVWLIGRRMRQATIAAAALGTDANVVEVEIPDPATDVNAPHAGYTEAALAGVGEFDFEPLAPEITAHLFVAPRLGTVTVTHEIVAESWS